MLRPFGLGIVMVLGLVASCAETHPNTRSEGTTVARPRRRGGVTPSGTDVGPVPMSSFGTPMVSRGDASGQRLAGRFVADSMNARVLCEGSIAQVPSTQSPWEPNGGMIARAFVRAEPRVLECNPPPNSDGRFLIRARFASSGAPQEFNFPEGRLSDELGRCLAEALCAVRTLAFRAPAATVSYPVVVLEPER